MSIFEIIRNIVISIFEIYMFTDLAACMLPKKDISKWNQRVVLCMSTIFLVIIGYGYNIHLNLFIIPGIYMLMSIFLFSDGIFKRICIAIFYYVMGIVPEFIFAIVLNVSSQITRNYYIYPNEVSETVMLLLMHMVTFIFIQCIKQIHKNGSYEKVQNKTFSVLLVLPLATLLTLVSIYYNDVQYSEINKIAMAFVACFLVFSNIVLFYLFDKLISSNEKAKEFEILYTKSLMENKNYQYNEKINEQHREFLHDIKKYIRTSVELLRQGATEQAIRLFNDVEGKIQQTVSESYSQNKTLNALLCERIAKAKDFGIEYKISIAPDLNVSFINAIDMISIIGNLLDNSIEAAAPLKRDGNIDLNMYMGNEGYFLIIDVKNNYYEEPLKGTNGFVSHKVNKKKHGIGLRAVRNIVDQYGGSMQLEVDKQEFSVIVILSVK